MAINNPSSIVQFWACSYSLGLSLAEQLVNRNGMGMKVAPMYLNAKAAA